MIKTVTTIEGVNAINFGNTADRYYWCKNIGETTLYVSAKEDISPDTDDVAMLEPGDIVMIETYNQDIYVLGAGKIQIYESETNDCPFKASKKGGETPDLSLYALKSKYGDTTIDVGRKADTTVGRYSTAEGYDTTASGTGSHAEGYKAAANGGTSHAEGYDTTASGDNSHAEGYKAAANGGTSHAEGRETTAGGMYSHAEGYKAAAGGLASHAGGTGTKALHDNEVAYGKYNESKDDTLFSVGDGTANNARHNAFEITASGGKLHDKDIATTDFIKSIEFSATTTNGYIWTGIPFPKYVIGVDLGHLDVIAQFYKGSNEATARAEWAMMFFSRRDVTTPLDGSFNGVIYYIG